MKIIYYEVNLVLAIKSCLRIPSLNTACILTWKDILVSVLFAVDIFFAFGARKIGLTFELITEQFQGLEKIHGMNSCIIFNRICNPGS